jgi:membrane-bound lytic murein transglycosylase
MEKSKIYIVMKSTGQYEDSFESPYKAFTSQEKADACVDKLKTYYDDLMDRYNQIDFDVQEKLDDLFDRYLQNTNNELFVAYKKAMSETVDAISEGEFDWDLYYDIEDDFKKNKELVNKYADICGLSDKERNAINVYHEYSEQADCDGSLPYFYVSSHVLDLE